MSDFGSKYIDPRLDPTARTINYIHVVFYIVVLCVSVIIALFVGAYLGRKSLQEKLAQEVVSTQSYQSGPVTTEKTPSSVKPQIASSESTSTSKEDVNSKDVDSSVSSASPSSPPMENIPGEEAKRTDSSSSSDVNTSEDNNAVSVESAPPNDTPSSSPAFDPTPPPKVDLTPLTPEVEILKPPVESAQQSFSPTSTQSFALPQRKPKTYAVQLSVLTGVDAKSRAENVLRKAIQKYPQYQFTMEKSGNSYKILAINFPNERSAREAIRFLSQESDFKGAFLIKP